MFGIGSVSIFIPAAVFSVHRITLAVFLSSHLYHALQIR
jgi:hypothetical protein